MAVMSRIMCIIIYYFILTSYKKNKTEGKSIMKTQRKIPFILQQHLQKEFTLQHRATTHLPAAGLQLSRKSSVSHETI